MSDTLSGIESDVEKVETDIKSAETVDAPAVEETAHAVGDIVQVVESDGTKGLGIITRLEKDVWGDAVAYVHRLFDDGRAIATKQTADLETKDENGKVIDKPVPVIQKVGS